MELHIFVFRLYRRNICVFSTTLPGVNFEDLQITYKLDILMKVCSKLYESFNKFMPYLNSLSPKIKRILFNLFINSQKEYNL